MSDRESLLEARSLGPQGRWWLRRRSEGYLYWHSYKTAEAREKWALIYHGRNDAIWMNADGSESDLFYLRDDRQWHP